MGFMFAIFGPPVITVFLFAVGAVPYRLWVTRKKPSRLARWAAIGGAAAVIAYGAGTGYGLAFTHPLDLCADRTGDGLYMDIGRDFTLTSVSRGSFPLSVTCHWSGGNDTEIVWFWATPLWYAGLACCLGCSGMLLVNRYERGGFTLRRTPPPPPPPRPPTSPR